MNKKRKNERVTFRPRELENTKGRGVGLEDG